MALFVIDVPDHAGFSNFDGIHSRTTHMGNAKFNSFWVSQFLSHCITCFTDPEKREQLPDIHDA